MEPGILAASWSPDDSLLVLVTGTQYSLNTFLSLDTHIGEEKLMLMTSTFDILSENPLHAAEFGEGILTTLAQRFQTSHHYVCQMPL